MVSGCICTCKYLARLLIFLFYFLYRLIGGKSDDAKLNTAVRLVLTQKKSEEALQQIFPGDNANSLKITGIEIVRHLIQLGTAVDSKTLTEAEAREKIKSKFPFIDQGNIDWLNLRGRVLLRRKAITFSANMKWQRACSEAKYSPLDV